MKLIKQVIYCGGLTLLLLFLSSCSSPMNNKQEEQKAELKQPEVAQPKASAARKKPGLPVHYNTPSYQVADSMSSGDEMMEEEDISLKVGASIRSTRGPQPLWDILKRLAALKGMNVSWASDVDQTVLVDVDINANDDFYKSIENLLRQVDYYHEMADNTIVVKYKETRQFHIAMPFTKQNFKTGTGGNVLGSNDASSNIDGTIELKSDDNTFDIWENIQQNMDAIISTWNTSVATNEDKADAEKDGDGGGDDADSVQQATRRVSSGGSMYIIDKPIGLITVSAPRPLLDRLDKYFVTLKRELYKQINIEAKIIEVELKNNSTIGINWTNVLKNFQIDGFVQFGDGGTLGQVWPTEGNTFISTIDLTIAPFSAFLNALKEEGDTKILSNPKLSVLNGQPSLITVGKNVTYVESIEADRDEDTNVTTFTVETERVLSGIGLALTATVLENNEVIMNLTPVTSELQEPIEYRQVGLGEVGLPVINVREMSTTVRVKDGEMLVIGGLISNTNETEGEFAPVVGDIPILKYLFGYEEKIAEKKELIILLRPRII
jgi:MSHA type pilus biogenesis protein MshL